MRLNTRDRNHTDLLSVILFFQFLLFTVKLKQAQTIKAHFLEMKMGLFFFFGDKCYIHRQIHVLKIYFHPGHCPEEFLLARTFVLLIL